VRPTATKSLLRSLGASMSFRRQHFDTSGDAVLNWLADGTEEFSTGRFV
jgi:hypothetical protein